MPYGLGFTPALAPAIDPEAERRRQMMLRQQALDRARTGYQLPQRNLGGPQMSPMQRQEAHPYAGYSPQVAGTYGGRPAGQTQMPQTQMQALTGQPWTARTMNRRPFGGTAAVRRGY